MLDVDLRVPELARRLLRGDERLMERDRKLDAQVVAVAREDRMRLHAHPQIRVAGRATVRARTSLTSQADALTVPHSGRDLHREPLRPFAGPRDLDDLFAPLVRLGQGHIDLGLDILAGTRASSRPAAGAAEEILGLIREPAVGRLPEEGPEEIREAGLGVAERIAGARIHVVEVAAGLTAHALRVALPVRSDGVVPLALLGIGEDLVGLVDLLEAPLGLRLLVGVRVVLAGH